MDRNTILKSIFCVVALTLVSCSQDELFSNADDANGEALPEGMYPLQIGSISVSAEGSGQPWTRVAETDDGSGSVFETGDMFYVKFEGSEQVGTYRIAEAGTVEAVDPVYWQSASEEQTIIAWYAPKAKGDGALDVSDQRDGLAYVIRAKQTATYNNTSDAVSLNFIHQLAKVRVYLRGSAYEGNANGVTLSYPASYTLTDGEVTQATSTTNSTIQMHKAENANYYEALVLPGEIATNRNPFTVTLGNKTVDVNLSSAPLSLLAGNRHDVTLRIHKQGTNVIDLSKQTSTYEINGGGTYYFIGSGNYGIKVSAGNPDIYLDDATVSVSSGNAISITGGTPTIHVVGTGSSVSSGKDTGIAVSNGATVTITGNSTADVLTAKGGTSGGYSSSDTAGAGIGSPINGTQGGNVIIRNVKVNATGGTITNAGGGAGIGSSSNGKCGNITIENAVINATGGDYSAAIGMGCNYQNSNSPSPSIGAITVTNSDVTAKAGYRAAAIGFSFNVTQMGSSTYCSGKITITTDNLETFLSHLSLNQMGSLYTSAQKIGKGQQLTYDPSTFRNTDNTGPWEGVVINGTTYANGVD